MVESLNKREGMSHNQKKDIDKIFKENKIRFTLPRRVTLEYLSKNPGHLSAAEIFAAIHQEYPNIGLATIYRTLELFSKIGLIHKFDFGDGRSRYELSEDIIEQHHHHLVCIKCGKVINYTEEKEETGIFLKELEDYLSKKYNFKITSHELYFYGLCSNCK